MKEDISRTAGNVYERIDKENWMVIPSYEETMIEHLRYQRNLRKPVMFPEDKRRELTEVSDEEIMNIVKKEMMGQ